MEKFRINQTPRQYAILKTIAILLVLLIIPLPAFCAGVVTTATEAALNSALVGGGTVTFSFSGTITLTNAEVITNNTVVDGS